MDLFNYMRAMVRSKFNFVTFTISATSKLMFGESANRLALRMWTNDTTGSRSGFSPATVPALTNTVLMAYNSANPKFLSLNIMNDGDAVRQQWTAFTTGPTISFYGWEIIAEDCCIQDMSNEPYLPGKKKV